MLTMFAEIGDPLDKGACTFADLLLESSLKSAVFFAKPPDGGPYVIVRYIGLPPLRGESFDIALESFVNQVVTRHRLLADFRPTAVAAAEMNSAPPGFADTNFIRV